MADEGAKRRRDREATVALMQAAGLRIEEARLDELTGLLGAASDAASRLDQAAARVPLVDGLVPFDPAWTGEECGS